MKKLSRKTQRYRHKKTLTLLSLLMIPMILTGCVPTTALGIFLQLMESTTTSADNSYYYDNGYTYESENEETYSSEDWSSELTDLDTQSSESYEVLGDGEYAQTIMVYMVGSDLESEYGNGSIDLSEMMDSGVDTDHNNIVVYTGGASEWQLEGLSAYENSILLLNGDEFEVLDTTDADNM